MVTILHRYGVSLPEENAYFTPNYSGKFPVYKDCPILKEGDVCEARGFLFSLVPGGPETGL